jgi:hypothetical protein
MTAKPERHRWIEEPISYYPNPGFPARRGIRRADTKMKGEMR